MSLVSQCYSDPLGCSWEVCDPLRTLPWKAITLAESCPSSRRRGHSFLKHIEAGSTSRYTLADPNCQLCHCTHSFEEHSAFQMRALSLGWDLLEITQLEVAELGLLKRLYFSLLNVVYLFISKIPSVSVRL